MLTYLAYHFKKQHACNRTWWLCLLMRTKSKCAWSSQEEAESCYLKQSKRPKELIPKGGAWGIYSDTYTYLYKG